MFSNCRHSRPCRQPFARIDTTVGNFGRKRLGVVVSEHHLQNFHHHHPTSETIGNTQYLEKQMEFTPIEILFIVSLFFLCLQETTSIYSL